MACNDRHAKKVRRKWPDALTGKDWALTHYGLALAGRAHRRVIMVAAIAVSIFASAVAVQAESIRVAEVTPFEIPAAIAELRAQPALGPTLVPLAPGQQQLTPQLLANYVARQQQLAAIDVDAVVAPEDELNTEVLLGYIARGTLGSGNSAVSAIANFTAPPIQLAPPSIDRDALAAYVANGYQPTERRLAHANEERNCLAQAIYHEARGESAAGQLAVANVIVNRARSGSFPDTLCGVIYQNADKGRYRCQFTFACDGRSDVPGERRAWVRSAELAADVYLEFATGDDVGALPGSALYYHTTAVRPSWANVYDSVARIDSHIFYSPN
jgi:hypothetical protein